jgi:acyl-CoA thioester hydrolase
MGIVSTRHPAVETSIQVRYAETDAQRVVYHGNYVIWFEVARTTYCERAGYPYPRMEAEGSLITVTDVRVRYRRSVRYGDTVVVRAWMTALKSRGCSFAYEIVLPDGRLAAEGETHHVFLDGAGRPRTVPEAIAEAFRTFAGLAV